MPAVQDILSSINQFAQARLPIVAGWRAANFEASGSVAPEWSDEPEGEYAQAGREPRLDEVMCDPVVLLIMQADRVQPAELQGLFEAAQRHRLTPAEDLAVRAQ